MTHQFPKTYFRAILASIVISVALPVPMIFAENSNLRSFVSLDTLFLSEDEGKSWQGLDILPIINRSVYLTSSSRHPSKPAYILVGTSFEGIYESPDSGKTWNFISEGRYFKPLFQGSGFYDEVTAIAYAGTDSDDFYFRIGFGGGIYRFDRAKKLLSAVPAQSPELASLPPSFRTVYQAKIDAPVWSLEIPGTRDLQLPPEGALQPGVTAEDVESAMKDPERESRHQKAMNRKGIYLNANKAQTGNLKKYFDLIKANGMNSIVVDFKDDLGRLTYGSKLQNILVSGGVKQIIDAPALIKAAHEAGIYVIARQVVFKDKHLYQQDKNALAIWDRRRSAPWGVFRTETIPANGDVAEHTETTQTEYWVDPYSYKVHEYNIAIAKEIESLGVDEIQLDYIRFPSDGNTRDILCRFHTGADGKTMPSETMTSRVTALTDFLRKVRKEIRIPIGTDVFGFNSWSRMSHLGQDIQAYSWFVDVISPMNYPSHFARDFFQELNYFDRASFIYSEGTERALQITGGRVIMRPYVQAFLLGGERKFSDPQIFDYLNRQVKSALSAGASGFTLWNNMGNYYMIDPKSFQASFVSQE